MRKWFQALSRARQIVWVVFALHALSILVLASESWLRRSPKRTKIAVHTVQFQEPIARVEVLRPPSQSAPAPKPEIASPVTQKTVSVPKPTAKKNIAPKAIPSKKAVVKPEKTIAPSPQALLLEEIQQTLREIAEPIALAPKKAALDIPVLSHTVLSGPQNETPPGIEERLSAFLQEMLQLPEFGEVKVKLSIDAKGRLTQFEIVEAKSEKNGQFLKNRLPELQFPCLNESASLTIVFRNA